MPSMPANSSCSCFKAHSEVSLGSDKALHARQYMQTLQNLMPEGAVANGHQPGPDLDPQCEMSSLQICKSQSVKFKYMIIKRRQ